ncbi:MAG: CHASE4 domain-containing protein [Armatimonadota bacterium]
MSIRTRTLIIIGITFLTLLMVMLFCTDLILLRSFARFEDQEMRADIDRTITAFDYEVSMLNKTLGDWASWDETYHFAADKNPDYIKNNLDTPTLANLGVDLMVFTDTHGRLLYAKYIDSDQSIDRRLPPSMLAALTSHSSLISLGPTPKTITGLLVLPQGPLFVVSQPILKNDSSGPAHGRFLMGRFIDSSKIDQLSGILQLSLQLYSTNERNWPQDTLAAQPHLAGIPIHVQRLDTRHVAGYTRLKDIEGRPTLLLQVTTSRTIFQYGVRARSYVLISLLLIGLALGGVIMWQLERVVLSRITRMRSAVRDIGENGTFTARLPVVNTPTSQHDELEGLALSVNDMLTALEAAHQLLLAQEALRESEERYRSLIEVSPLAFYLLEEDRCLFTNAAGIALLGANDPAAVLGHSVLEVIASEEYESIQRQFDEVVAASGRFLTREVTITRLDGVECELEIVACPFSPTHPSTIQIIATDISARKRTETEIHAYQARLRNLAADASLAEDRERQRIARDLHDHIGQTLAASLLWLGTLKDTVPEKTIRKKIEEVRMLLEQAILWTRTLTVDLSPPILYQLGLEPAISWLAEQFHQRHGITIHVHSDEATLHAPEISSTLFRITRELLYNVVKHAQATQVTIQLSTDGKCSILSITDNGIGFTPALPDDRRGFGLFSIRERLACLGGRLDIDSAAGQGTCVTVTLPLENNEEIGDAAHRAC